MNFGADAIDGAVRFRFWAPKEQQVSVVLDGGTVLAMRNVGQGWHELVTENARPGTLYSLRLGGSGLGVPDPASRFQPRDVHGPSEVIDPGSYRWPAQPWRGRPW